MVIDSSAILAIVFDEPERDAFVMAIERAQTRLMSAVNLFEAGVVADHAKNPAKAEMVDELVRILRLSIEPATPSHARLAREAYRRFGKGNHAARLNLGDCFAYALARETGEPLLFKGNDFRLTDIEAV